MAPNKAVGKKGDSLVRRTVLGVGVSLVTMLALCALLAWLVISEHVGQAGQGIWIVGILLVSSALGAMLSAGGRQDGRLMQWLLHSGSLCLLLLGINLTVFQGQLSGAVWKMAAVLCGGAAAVLPAMGNKGRNKRYPVRRYR